MTSSRLATNRLLDALPAGQLRRMLAACERVDLTQAEVLCGAGEVLRHVYFPIRSYVSMVLAGGPSASLEVGLVGREGVLGIPLALGIDVSPLDVVVEGSGPALRIDADGFCRELERSEALRDRIDRYLFVRLNQLAQGAACTRFHLVEARLARRLLMAQDRSHADTVGITHAHLACMLGVQRVAITRAATSLRRRGLVRYGRGSVTIVDRRGLRAASCDCYRADREFHERVLG